MVNQLLDTLIFTSAAFLDVFPLNERVQMFITTYFIKWLIAVIDTPFL
jgi:queuosine precursor transporter